MIDLPQLRGHEQFLAHSQQLKFIPHILRLAYQTFLTYLQVKHLMLRRRIFERAESDASICGPLIAQ